MRLRTDWPLAALAVTLAFGLGRWSACSPPPPSEIHESSKESSTATWESAEAAAASTGSSSETSNQSNRTEEWYRPDGTLARRLVLGSVSLSRSREHAEASASRSEEVARRVKREVVREVVRYDPGRWHLSLGLHQDAGAALRREFRPRLGVSLTYRLIGPLQAAAFASAPFGQWRQAQAGVGLGLSFRF